jgi:alpha-1,3-rhamnosyl/mannosyltransferase
MDLPAQYVLYIGSAREKNLPDMLRAFAKCVDSSRESLGRVHLLLASGNAPEQNSLMETARELDIEKQVRILGPLTEEEKHVLYDQALALFSVGCPEKFDITILEAQAAGLPVLASDEKSAREITDDSALLVDHDDVDAMASELTKLLQDASLRERLAGAGKKNAQRFNWQNTAQKVLDIYKLLM